MPYDQAILVIAPNLPEWDRAAGDRRLDAILRLLAKRAPTYLVVSGPRSPTAEQYESRLANNGVALSGYGWRSCVRALLHRGYSHVLYEFHFVAQEYLRIARRLQPTAYHVVDSVDIHALRVAAAQAIGLEREVDLPALERQELSVYRSVDCTVVLTEAEEQHLRSAAVPNLVRLPIIIEAGTRSERIRSPVVVFVGNFRHSPNADGIAWFLDAVCPRVISSEPQARLLIAGVDPPTVLQNRSHDATVSVLGFVEDLPALLDQAAVSIAPLRYGGGMKGKVCEALAHGVPVVSTSFGAQGLESLAGDFLRIGDTPTAFRDHVLILLRERNTSDDRSRIAITTALTAFGPDVARTAIAELMTHGARDGWGLPGRLARFVGLAIDRSLRPVLRRAAPSPRKV